jgi:hypothetical protein
MVNPFRCVRPSVKDGVSANSSLASVIKSSKLYAERLDTNRSRAQNTGRSTERSLIGEDYAIDHNFNGLSPENAVNRLIKKAKSKSSERYNYQMSKKISETLANQI